MKTVQTTYTYTVFHCDGTTVRGEVTDWPAQPSLKQLKAVIEPLLGGGMEHVTVLDPAAVPKAAIDRGDYRDLFVDEEGHDKELPFNEAATAIYRANWLRAHPGDRADELDWIVGPAVLFHQPVWW